MVMGCYGIGVSRTIAAIIEQYNDEDGIKWPAIAAPYKVIVIPTKTNDEEIMALSEKLYNAYIDAGYETLIDDRNERPGVKFKDADLLGIPLRVTVGRRAAEGIVELKFRMDGTTQEADFDQALEAAGKIQ